MVTCVASTLFMFSIGHSTRTFDELVSLLRENGVERLADIRRYPGSRRHPHFSSEALQRELPKQGIAYEHWVELGGRRKPSPDSRNVALRNEQFRAYADYMATPEFRTAVDRLLTSDLITCVMCAEAVPWRCHRNLLSDDLVRRGVEVLHILGPRKTGKHALSKIARIEGDHVVYRDVQETLDFDAL